MDLATTRDVKEFIEPLSSSACSIHKSVPERIGKEIDFVLQPLRCPNAVLFNDRVHLVSALDELVEPSRAIIQHIDELDTFTVEQLEGEAVSVGLVLHRGKSISYVSQDIHERAGLAFRIRQRNPHLLQRTLCRSGGLACLGYPAPETLHRHVQGPGGYARLTGCRTKFLQGVGCQAEPVSSIPDRIEARKRLVKAPHGECYAQGRSERNERTRDTGVSQLGSSCPILHPRIQASSTAFNRTRRSTECLFGPPDALLKPSIVRVDTDLEPGEIVIH